MKKALKIISAVLLITVLACLPAFAGQVTLAWDPNNPEPTGYALFERNSATGAYDYANPIWPTDGADHPETTATITVADGMEHAFVVRAYQKVTGLDGTEQTVWSGDSNEVTFVSQPPVGDPQNLIIQAVQYLSRAIDALSGALAALENQ